MEAGLIDARKHDGTTLRRCSHDIPFEEACEACVEEGIAREKLRRELRRNSESPSESSH